MPTSTPLRSIWMLFFLLLVHLGECQNQNLNWTFGDSCGISFNSTGINSFFKSNVTSRGTCVTISDTSGNLLFYASSADKGIYNAGTTLQMGVVFNKQHQVMQNGQQLSTTSWYREMQVIPYPGNPNKFLLFLAGEDPSILPGLRYCIIDLQQNGGMGTVTQKNILLDPAEICDGMLAVQHGNGRDWWLLYKTWGQPSNEFRKLLIDPTGIHPYSSQNIGINHYASFWRIILNPFKDEIISLTNRGLLESYSFNRCTGILGSATTILNVPTATMTDDQVLWDGDFSGSGRYFYTCTPGMPGYLYQLDLQNSNPWQNRVILDTISIPAFPGSALRRAPDGKIYRATAWNDGINYNYPYPDTTFNLYNTHLGVINYPDSAGFACDYQGFSVALPPYCRTYLGLPANVDFNKGRLTGSLCDTLGTVGITGVENWAGLSVFPNPCYNKIGFQLPENVQPELINLLDASGRLLRSFISTDENRYLKELDVSDLKQGVYIIEFQAGSKVARRKIVKL